MAQKSDAELVALARGGDQSAFNCLVERYVPLARRVATRAVGDPEIGRELAQEALLQAYLSLDRLRDSASFRTWLHGIVLNVCRSYAREQRADALSRAALSGGLRLEAGGVARGADPQWIAEQRERERLIREAILSLSSQDQAAVRLFYDEQRSLREVAEALGASVGAVKVRLHNARKRIREGLRPYYPEFELPMPGQRRRTMVKVNVADVMERESPQGGRGWVILLRTERADRALEIWVGQPEATAIAMALGDFPAPRPMTYTLMASVLQATGARLQEVRVESLRENTYYAVLKLRVGKTVRELDARPSDAIALAQRTGSPILVAGEVMQTAGREIPEAERERHYPGPDSLTLQPVP